MAHNYKMNAKNMLGFSNLTFAYARVMLRILQDRPERVEFEYRYDHGGSCKDVFISFISDDDAHGVLTFRNISNDSVKSILEQLKDADLDSVVDVDLRPDPRNWRGMRSFCGLSISEALDRLRHNAAAAHGDGKSSTET